jgi:hypothetical protein
MIKKTHLSLSFLFLALNIYSTNSFAINYDVIGPCSETPLYKNQVEVSLSKSVGQNSVEIFDKEKIEYVGNENGMNSILNTPTGNEAIEILSETKMRAYGWCFSINGIIPDVISSQIYFSDKNDSLKWFFAYSTYDQGVWTDYCVPSYTIKSPFICK